MTATKRFTMLAPFARNHATRPLRSVHEALPLHEHAEIMRNMHREEALEKTKLLANVQALRSKAEASNHAAQQTIDSKTSNLVQNHFVCTERLAHAEKLAGISRDLLNNCDETEQLVEDISREPYPEWSPGDPDVVTRRVADPKTSLKEVALEAHVKRLEVEAHLDSIELYMKELEEVKQVWQSQGAQAGRARAKEIVARRRSDPVVQVPLKPIDLDAIEEVSSAQKSKVDTPEPGDSNSKTKSFKIRKFVSDRGNPS